MSQDDYHRPEKLEKETPKLKIIEDETCLTLVDKDNHEKGDVQFYYNKDGLGYPFAFLESAFSKNPGQGHFRILFNRLESIARREGAEYILLTVDFDNDHAIEIYEHLGFYSLGNQETSAENIDRIFMRKDLFDCE
jgi:GNAT superfamily N-acetyltransferase